jgi:hypothetical protein
MVNKERKIVLGICLILAGAIVLLSGSVSAEFWTCFNEGQVIDYCNPAVQDRTCGSSLCLYCMDEYVEDEDCFIQGNFNVCNNQAQDCTEFGAGEIDSDPPVMIINVPQEGEVYSKRSVPLDLEVDERSDIYVIDNLNNRGRFTRICSDCTSHQRGKGFKEGLNDITFKVVDVVGNEQFYTRTFFVDSKKPRMTRSEPRKGFASGDFSVQFREDNPELLVLKYGNSLTEFREMDVSLDSCQSFRGKTDCFTSVDLSDFNGQEIIYWFELTDKAGTTAIGRQVFLDVDTVSPVIEELEYTLGTRGSVEIVLKVDDDNFDEATYKIVSDVRGKEKRFCSRLRDGMCFKRLRFRDSGEHVIDFTVFDEAGNAVAERLTVVI